MSNAAIILTATDAGSGVANDLLQGRWRHAGQPGPRSSSARSVPTPSSSGRSTWPATSRPTRPRASPSPHPCPSTSTAPATTSNALATYVSSATIKLTATDAGSGVANTYYKVDGGAQVAGTSIAVSTLGAHTIEFWSVDVAGNVEAHKTASFTVTAPVPVDVTAPATTSNALATYVSSATIKLTATDAGSGVANTYYKVDGGAQVAGTSIPSARSVPTPSSSGRSTWPATSRPTRPRASPSRHRARRRDRSGHDV